MSFLSTLGPMIKTVKVHDLIQGEDTVAGEAVLVDRLWPRGVAKQKLTFDGWYKDVAPSPELRKWFGHEEERFPEFSRRYKAELDANDSAELKELIKQAHEDLTLLFAAKDRQINHAVVLKEWLEEQVSQ